MMYGLCEFCEVQMILASRVNVTSQSRIVRTGAPAAVPPMPIAVRHAARGLSVLAGKVGGAVGKSALGKPSPLNVHSTSDDSGLPLIVSSVRQHPAYIR